MKSILTTLAVVTAVALGAAGAFADDPTKPANTQPAVTAGKPITLAELGTLLEAMGFNPEPYKNKEDKVSGYTVRFKHGTWDMVFDVYLNAAGDKVRFLASLGKFGEQTAMPAAIAMKLLAAQDNLGSAYFIYVESTGWLYLFTEMPAQNLKPGALRPLVESFCESIKATEPLWNAKKWPAAPARSTTPPAPKG